MLHQWNRAGLLGQRSPSICAAALCAVTGYQGTKGNLFMIAPHFAHIRRHLWSLYQDADGTMQCFLWHEDQKAGCHCLAANRNLANDSDQDES